MKLILRLGEDYKVISSILTRRYGFVLNRDDGMILFHKFDKSTRRYPAVIKVLGVITMLAAVVFLLMGRATFIESISSIIETLKDLAPMTALFTILVGGFLYFAYTEKKSLA